MALGFGFLHKARGVISYRLSPHEQRAFAGLTNAPFNVLRRVRSNVFTIVPPMLIGYLVYTWGNAEHERLIRKNPADYANDV